MFVENHQSKRSHRGFAWRSPGLLVSAAVLCLAGVGLTMPAIAATNGAQRTPVVVGLGDSFTSGVGLADLDPASGDCRRGLGSYPLEAARTLDVRGSNAACSGAQVSAITASFKGQAPQVSKVASADFVVMTIGGNDVLSLSNAANLFLDEASVQAELAALAPRLRDAYTAVVDAAPEATVMVLAYPDFFPTTDTGSCSPLIESALPTAHRGFDLLNQTIEAEATAAGVTFLDTSRAFEGHDICSADPWATGLEDMTIALHPNDKGHAALGGIVADAIEPLLGAQPAKTTKASEVPAGNPRPAAAKEKPHASTIVPTENGAAVLGQPAASTTAQAVPEPTADAATERLAETGDPTLAMSALGSSLVGIGLGLVWLRATMVARLEPAMVPAMTDQRRRS